MRSGGDCGKGQTYHSALGDGDLDQSGTRSGQIVQLSQRNQKSILLYKFLQL